MKLKTNLLSIAILLFTVLLPLATLDRMVGLAKAFDLVPVTDTAAAVMPQRNSAGLSPNLNTAPVLSSTAVLTLPAIVEDVMQPSGDKVSNILARAGDPITDPDAGAKEGVAVVGAGGANGTWQYSIENPPTGEAGWLPFGVVSDTKAVLLNDNAYLRYVPTANYFGPSDNLTVRAWDQTTGKNGQTDADVSVNGGSTAFSVNTNTISLNVTPINDPPVLSGLPVEPKVYVEDADPLPLVGESFSITDVDNTRLASVTIRLMNQPDGDAESLQATTGDTGITAVFESSVLRLTGLAPIEVYQEVVKTVAYKNTSQDPNPIERAIQIVAADSQSSSLPAGLIVQVLPTNDPPELDLDGIGPGLDYEAIFFINRGPVPIVAPSLVVTDVDNTTLKSATVQILNPGEKDGDILSANLEGTSNIKRTYDSTTGLMSLTGADTIANYQRVLRTVVFDNILREPDTKDRFIRFTLYDSDDMASVARQTTVRLVPAEPVVYYLSVIAWNYRRNEEPNDSCPDALGLNNNTTEVFHADDFEDWFFFDLRSPANTTVEASNFAQGQVIVYSSNPSGSCGDLRLLRSNGDNLPNKSVPLGIIGAGRYFVRVIYDGPLGVNPPYRLYIRTAPAP